MLSKVIHFGWVLCGALSLVSLDVGLMKTNGPCEPLGFCRKLHSPSATINHTNLFHYTTPKTHTPKHAYKQSPTVDLWSSSLVCLFTCLHRTTVSSTSNSHGYPLFYVYLYRCPASFIVVCIVAWDAIPKAEADGAYKLLVHKLNKFGLPTTRRCATNENRTCACQGKQNDWD